MKPNTFLTEQELSMKLFQTVELGLFGKLGTDLTQITSTEIPVPQSTNAASIDKDEKKKKKEDKKLTKESKKRPTEVRSQLLLLLLNLSI
jgi:hypothetical protein